MAGDWIKMRSDLYRDPKVSVIADRLLDTDGPLAAFISQNMQRHMTVTRNVMRNVTVGALVSVWGVMRQRGKSRECDLVCDGVTLAVLDDIADIPGFGAAMACAAWVIETESGLVFPRFFEDYNVDPEEKSRNKGAERQRRFRGRQKAGEDDVSVTEDDVTVTRDSNVTRDVTVTHREEESREEKREEKKPKGFSSSATTPAVPCPYERIIAMYHSRLPDLPGVKLMPKSRQAAMRKLWGWVLSSSKSDGARRATSADEALQWIDSYFARAAENDFLMGRARRGGEHENWRCDLDFLLTDRGMRHVIEKTQEKAA